MLHHPARRDVLPRLVARLDGHPFDLVIDSISPWNGMKALLSRDVGTAHLVVLQDDAVPCMNFLDCVRNVIRHHPDRLIALFHARSKPGGTAVEVLTAPERSFVELRFAKGSDWLPTVALVWPRAAVEAFRRYRWAGSRNQRGDDLPIGQFARSWGGAVACVPSIVQHPDDVESQWMPRRARYGRDPTRLAARYADDGGPWRT